MRNIGFYAGRESFQLTFFFMLKGELDKRNVPQILQFFLFIFFYGGAVG